MPKTYKEIYEGIMGLNAKLKEYCDNQNKGDNMTHLTLEDLDPIDLELEFHKHAGETELYGLTVDVAPLLATYDQDRYETALNDFAEGKGYWKDEDTDLWYDRSIEPLDFSGATEGDR